MMTYDQWLIQQRMIATLSGDELSPQEIALDWQYYLKREWEREQLKNTKDD